MVRKPIRVTVWNEFRSELHDEAVRRTYPQGIHVAVSDALHEYLGDGVQVRHATLDIPEHGLSEAVLRETDVLTWWGHAAHGEVNDAVVDRVQQAVLRGMGLIVLHSAHHAKVFKRLMGTTCNLKWREAHELERVWVVNPGHPIADGLGEHFEIRPEEMYGELFDVPPPDELIFVSWFEGGEVFRTGMTWTRGKGKVFYFRPGHETYPTYRDPNVRRVIANAVRWAAPRSSSPYVDGCPNLKHPLSPIANR